VSWGMDIISRSILEHLPADILKYDDHGTRRPILEALAPLPEEAA
jgi:hypothetical protein